MVGRAMSENEIDYLRRRTAEELAVADDCADLAAAQIHRRLSALYASKIDELSRIRSKGPVQRDAPDHVSTKSR